MTGALLPVAEARARVLARARLLEAERVPVAVALDRTLGEDLFAAGPAPPFDCSAMDGYAVTAGASGRVLEVRGEARAGTPARLAVVQGAAVRISTGAAVPDGTEAVIRQEDVRQLDEHRVELRAPVAPGANIRAAGEDLQRGARLLRAGTTLGVAELGAAVAAGAGELVVRRRPRVSVLCTGDELRPPGEPLAFGQVHNSNAVMLAALVARCEAEPAPPQLLPDDRAATEAGLRASLERSDVVVVAGGVSVGPHDHVRPALAAAGVREDFWGVALQPGKPTWFGCSDRALVFGLPGNPVSAVVTFTLFVRPLIAALLGVPDPVTQPRWARLGISVRRNRMREQALRVNLESRPDGMVAIPNGAQGSHLVTSLLGAQALAMIPPGSGELPAGVEVPLLPLAL